MMKLLEDLQNLIRNQTELYTKLLDILRRENEIILDSAVDDLFANNKKKEVLILQIKLLDESCEQILEKIYTKVKNFEGKPTLIHLIKILKEPHKAPLKAGYSKLIAIAQSVKELNADNERLIHGSLRAIKSSISFLVSCATSGGPIYENNGQYKTNKMVRSMLREEA